MAEEQQFRSDDQIDDIYTEENESLGAEEDYETDEEIDKRQFGIYQALPVDDEEPDWESGEPSTVEEYLRRVRQGNTDFVGISEHEARHLPSVVTSAVDPRHFDDLQTPGYAGVKSRIGDADTCPEEMKPSVAWIHQFLNAFHDLRYRLHREHEAITGQIPGVPLRIPPPPSTDATSPVHVQGSPSSLMPELAALKGLDQVTLVNKLLKAVRLIISSTTGITPEQSANIYALSARLERPLHADTAAAYRSLLTRCKEWRAQLSAGARDPLLPHLNILIVLAGAYFKQDEELAAVWEEDEDFNDVIL